MIDVAEVLERARSTSCGAAGSPRGACRGSSAPRWPAPGPRGARPAACRRRRCGSAAPAAPAPAPPARPAGPGRAPWSGRGRGPGRRARSGAPGGRAGCSRASCPTRSASRPRSGRPCRGGSRAWRLVGVEGVDRPAPGARRRGAGRPRRGWGPCAPGAAGSAGRPSRPPRPRRRGGRSGRRGRRAAPRPRHLAAILGVARSIVNVRASRFNVADAIVRDRPPPAADRTRFLPPMRWMGVIAVGSSSLLVGRTGPASGCCRCWPARARREPGRSWTLPTSGSASSGTSSSTACSPSSGAAPSARGRAPCATPSSGRGLRRPRRAPAGTNARTACRPAWTSRSMRPGRWSALVAWTARAGCGAGASGAAAWGAGLLAGLATSASRSTWRSAVRGRRSGSRPRARPRGDRSRVVRAKPGAREPAVPRLSLDPLARRAPRGRGARPRSPLRPPGRCGRRPRCGACAGTCRPAGPPSPGSPPRTRSPRSRASVPGLQET